jgi:hypothetical protein
LSDHSGRCSLAQPNHSGPAASLPADAGAHWRTLRSTNPPEPSDKDTSARRTDVVGILADDRA